MRPVALTSIIILAILSAGIFFFSNRQSIANEKSTGTDIIAFGDSLVAGFGASQGNDFVSLLSTQIGEPIINLGVPGDTTADALQRLDELDAYNPRIVLVLLGGNDFLRRVPSNETFANLELIIRDIQNHGSAVILLGVRGNLLGSANEKRFEELSQKYDTAYVPDVLDGLFGQDELMSDSIHPNDRGYARIAERIYPVLKNILK